MRIQDHRLKNLAGIAQWPLGPLVRQAARAVDFLGGKILQTVYAG
jgi:hypothetical protein